MPQQHYRCPACGVLELIVYRLADVSAPGWPPRCVACQWPSNLAGVSIRTPMEMAPQSMIIDARSDGGTGQSFQKFTVDVDGSPVEIDSLHKLRTVERESEQRYRNGEGAPLRFRMWNQESSNREVNAFGDRGTIGAQSYDAGTPHTKSGKISVRKHGETKPTVPLGPGLSRAKSPLKG